jgi:hypothetical protein
MSNNVTARVLGKLETNRIVSKIKKNAEQRFKKSSINFISRHANQILTINQLYKLLGKYSVEYFAMNDSANRKKLFEEMIPIMYIIKRWT